VSIGVSQALRCHGHCDCLRESGGQMSRSPQPAEAEARKVALIGLRNRRGLLTAVLRWSGAGFGLSLLAACGGSTAAPDPANATLPASASPGTPAPVITAVITLSP